MLVLDEIFGFPDLADIMVIGAHPRKERIFTDRFGCCFSKVPDHNAVVIGPGTFVNQLLEQRLVGLEQFKELDVGGYIEQRLEEGQRDRYDH